jgi:hypothetical protein
MARDGRARRCLIGAKMANVGVPLVLKKLVDQLSDRPAHPHALLVLPLGALVAYGALRLSTTCSPSCANSCSRA